MATDIIALIILLLLEQLGLVKVIVVVVAGTGILIEGKLFL